MDSGAIASGCKQEIQGPCCWRCHCIGRVKERRSPLQVVPDGQGGACEVRAARTRWFCPKCHRSWTEHEPGGYPSRTYTIAWSIAVVGAMAADPRETLSSIARKFRCHRRTVHRALAWVASFSGPVLSAGDDILLDPPRRPPAAPAFPGPPGRVRVSSCMEVLARAGHLVRLFEALAGLLRERCAALVAGPGLATVLRFLFDRSRTVYYMTWVSPPLRGDWPPGPRAS